MTAQSLPQRRFNPEAHKGHPILILLILATAVMLMVQLGLHVYEKGNVLERDNVLSYFDQDGHCKAGNGMVMFSPLKQRWMYGCFLKDGNVALWIVVDKIQHNSFTREITSFIAEPRYLTSCLGKYGYILVEKTGELPVWFLALFGG